MQHKKNYPSAKTTAFSRGSLLRIPPHGRKKKVPRVLPVGLHLALERFCRSQGADLFGVADVSAIKNEFALSPKVTDKLDRAVCLGVRLSSAILEEISDAPTRLYFHHYRTVNALLDQLAVKAANYIQTKGYAAMPIPASQILDWERQKGHLPHKEIGRLAGLGWIGRNNLLVNKSFGSQFRLCTVLTNIPLPADKPTRDNCGRCRACVVVCPAQAIKQSPAEFRYLQCLAKLKQFQKERLAEQYICGVCVRACAGTQPFLIGLGKR
jgi:epoxyqueuosine reductase QueG